MADSVTVEESGAPVPIRRLFDGDYWSRLAIIVPLVFWGLTIAIVVFDGLPGFGRRSAIDEESEARFLIQLAVIATVIAIPLLYHRIRTIRALMASGERAEGVVDRIGFRRDRGRVHYSYRVGETEYNGGNAIPRTTSTKHLRPGDAITVRYDVDNPGRAVIDEIFR